MKVTRTLFDMFGICGINVNNVDKGVGNSKYLLGYNPWAG